MSRVGAVTGAVTGAVIGAVTGAVIGAVTGAATGAVTGAATGAGAVTGAAVAVVWAPPMTLAVRELSVPMSAPRAFPSVPAFAYGLPGTRLKSEPP